MSTSMSLRLCTRAPRTSIIVGGGTRGSLTLATLLVPTRTRFGARAQADFFVREDELFEDEPLLFDEEPVELPVFVVLPDFVDRPDVLDPPEGELDVFEPPGEPDLFEPLDEEPDFFCDPPLFDPPLFDPPLFVEPPEESSSSAPSSVPELAPRRLFTLRSRASIRLSTLPPSASRSFCSWRSSPKVASVSTVSPCSSFSSSRVRSCSWYSPVNGSGSKSSLNCSTSAPAISTSFAFGSDLLPEGAKSTSRRSSGQRMVCSTIRSSWTRSTPSRVLVRRVKVTIAVRSVSSRVRRSST